jgi:RNA polymerase sigma-70 factor (ECF subfamily)
MSAAIDQTTQIQRRLDRIRSGDESARDELLSLAADRLTRLARKMLRSYPAVARWEQTGDVVQSAAMRLCRALRDVVPESPRSFFNFAAVQIRRELIDLARHHYGPLGFGANHASGAAPQADRDAPADGPSNSTHEPGRLADWTEFHEAVESLADEPREVFNLLWYQELTQAEAASVLGVTERVVKWRWRAARLALHEALGGEAPC